MGCRVDDSGISIQLYDYDGIPVGAPRHGKFAVFYGGPRPNDGALTQYEKAYPGSQDWLTMIAIADTQDKLNQILTEPDLPAPTSTHTSSASHRVLVKLDIGGQRETLRARTTISSGPIISLDPKRPIVHVVHVKVLPEGAELRPTHPLVEEFTMGAKFFKRSEP